jgi:hypothetical protein
VELEAMPKSKQPTRAFSLEETSREARENWRGNYYDNRARQLEPQPDARQDAEKTQPERDAGLDFDPEP